MTNKKPSNDKIEVEIINNPKTTEVPKNNFWKKERFLGGVLPLL